MPAQPGAVADAALRPQDRCVFEVQKWPNAFPIYWCGAAKRQDVGRSAIIAIAEIKHVLLERHVRCSLGQPALPMLVWLDAREHT